MYPGLCPLVFAIAVVCVPFLYLRLVVMFGNSTFYRVRLAPRPIPNLEGQGILLWVITFDLSGMGGPASSYATASIALRII